MRDGYGFNEGEMIAGKILHITLLAYEMSVVVWQFFGITFIWDLNENWPFSVLWPLLSF